MIAKRRLLLLLLLVPLCLGLIQAPARAERSVKPFVIDRKNFLFANTPRGARASAVMFSMIETAKENGLDPFKYLVYAFEKAPNSDIRNNLDMLPGWMPWCVPNFVRPVKAACPAV